MQVRTANGYIHAVRGVIVHNLSLELFGRVIAKPFAREILKGNELGPNMCWSRYAQPTFTASIQMALITAIRGKNWE
jgi:hypothetical protein